MGTSPNESFTLKLLHFIPFPLHVEPVPADKKNNNKKSVRKSEGVKVAKWKKETCDKSSSLSYLLTPFEVSIKKRS